MSIGEPHSARLARERLEAIKKYLPVRDSVKQQLQSRQESQVEFEEDTKQLFKPITETTKPLLPALEKTAEATGKIAERTKQTKRILRGLPAEIAAAMPVPEIPEDEDQPEGAEAPAPEQKSHAISTAELINKFNEETVKAIKNLKLQELAEFAVDGFSRRDKLMKPEHAKDIKTREQWQKALYRIHMNVEQARADDTFYRDYARATDDLIRSRREEKTSEKQAKKKTREQKPPKQKTPKPFEQSLRDYPESPRTPSKPSKKKPPKPSEEEEEEFEDAQGATGSGLGSGLITCPNNVLADVDRLEILIGGKRAGNNSSEIINEAADICKRLFSGGIMDINVYRSLINEIADDYHSD
jgi:hypothetical protein